MEIRVLRYFLMIAREENMTRAAKYLHVTQPTLSKQMKQLEEDPWQSVANKYQVGDVYTGKVTNITDYGAFVELEDGIEGLVHVSEMSWTRKNVHPGKIVSTSQEVEVKVLEVDPEKRRISLGIKQCTPNPWAAYIEEHPVGSVIEGKIKNITEFGLFIGLSDEIDGMIHLSDISWDKAGEEAVKDYTKGQEIQAKIIDVDVDKERISLGIKQLTEDAVSGALEGLKKGDIVIYESTVYPGVTEEECIPVIERISKLTFNVDFFAGYSPERINPGDKVHTVEKIKKVTSGSTPAIADIVDGIYSSILLNGTYKAPSIRVAEASKIIENSQRDVNIAFMNELAKIFNAMGIDTNDVIEAASTKWNFIKLKPGLVGGHCISVDPYYLIQKAQVYGVLPRVMSAARRLNDGMGEYVANQVVKLMNKKGVLVKDAYILLLGITFKENCPDIRNTKIVDIYHTLKEYTNNIVVYDPWADEQTVFNEYGIKILTSELQSLKFKFDAVILGVGHDDFLNIDIRSFLKGDLGVIYDVKSVLPKDCIDGRL